MAAGTLALLPSLAVRALGPLGDPVWALRSVMNTHALWRTGHLAGLVAHVERGSWTAGFRPERVGVCALPGARQEDSCLLPGLCPCRANLPAQ